MIVLVAFAILILRVSCVYNIQLIVGDITAFYIFLSLLERLLAYVLILTEI